MMNTREVSTRMAARQKKIDEAIEHDKWDEAFDLSLAQLNDARVLHGLVLQNDGYRRRMERDAQRRSSSA